jgi:hypothetical protein
LKNDCAITYNPQDSEYYILETVPGLHFRNTWNRFSHVAGLIYFRKLVDDYRYGQSNLIKDVLGSEDSWKQYEGFLEVIPFSAISNVATVPLAGSNGFVYQAEWLCPQKINMPAPELRQVALKTLKVYNEKEQKRFLNEV